MNNSRFILCSAFALTLAVSMNGAKAANDSFWSEDAAQFDRAEKRERNVDEAALTAQHSAAGTLQKMIAKVRNQPQEADYLFKLAEIQQQSASMDFRVGMGGTTAKSAPLKSFHSELRASIATLDRLLAKYPNSSNIAKATYMRGRAHHELGAVKLASRDYRQVVSAHASAPESIPAMMALADFASQAQRPQEAIPYLKSVERKTASPYYPFALYQLAWAHYSLRQIPSAMRYAEKLIQYYHAKIQSQQADRADLALLENMYKDAPVFVFSGFESGRADLRAPQALAYFKKLDAGKGTGLSTMLATYAKLLRSNDHARELRAFNAAVLASEGTAFAGNDGYELLLTQLEHDLNQSRYESVPATLQSISPAHAKNKSDELRARGEKLVYEGALRIQNRFAKAVATPKGARSAYALQLATTLDALYAAFFKMIDDRHDLRVRTAHANLGETHFATGNFASATLHYRWIVLNGSDSDPATASASLKAIASRAEELRGKNLLPKDLQAQSLKRESSRAANPLITEWISWMDAHPAQSGLDHFIFEGNRALYAQGKIRQSLDRMRGFAMKYPQSAVAGASLSLVVDTYVVSQDWVALAKISKELNEHAQWQNTPLQKRVAVLASDAHFKQAKALSTNGAYDAAIEQVDSLDSLYGATVHRVEAYALAGDAALAKNDRDLALRYYGQLVAASPTGEKSAKTRLLMAKIEEERFNFAAAAKHYQVYCEQFGSALSAKELTRLRTRVATLAWIGGTPALVQSTLQSRGYCAKNAADCQRFEALQSLNRESIDSARARRAFQSIARALPEVRAIYATAALENWNSLSPYERRVAVSNIITHWTKTESLARFTLISRVSKSIPKVVQAEREAMNALPVRADERSMTARVNRIKDFELFTAQVANLPLTTVQARVAEETATAYSDFAIAVRTLPAPRGLDSSGTVAYAQLVQKMVSPFERKSAELSQQAAALGPRAQFALDAEFIENADKRETLLQRRWAQAVESANWPQVAYFVQESKRLAPTWTATAGRAVSLAQSGATSEGQFELRSYCQSHRATADSAMKTCASLSILPTLTKLPKLKRSKTMIGKNY